MKTTAHPVHGGLNLAELRSLGLSPEGVLDFSASINPLGPAPGVLEAVGKVNLAAYPDPDCLELREALSERLGIGAECILVGNGSTELIHLVARAYLTQGDSAVIFSPTFGEYAAACHVQGVEPEHIFADALAHPHLSPLPSRERKKAPSPSTGEGRDEGETPPQNVAIASTGIQHPFTWDMAEAQEIIGRQRPWLVFLCNPNNPTGVYVDEATVRGIADGCSLLVLDEAYISFVEDAWDARPLLETGNVILLRSMTKDYALTGLRLGYMLAPPDVVERVRMFQYSWSVNAVAQAAGIAALGQPKHVEKGREAVHVSKACLMKGLGDLGLEPVLSAANFMLVRVGNAADLRMKLLKRHGICVRDCVSFGLPEHIRVGIRRIEDCQRLVAAVKEVIADG